MQDGLAAIHIQSDNNLVAGNYIGTDASGTVAHPNSDGVFIEGGDDNTIGGPTAADRNVISANAGAGVLIDGTASGADGNVVTGNYIGLDATGLSAMGNTDPGVWVLEATNTLVGGPTSADGNFLADNFNDVFLGDFDTSTSGNHTTVRNNSIGLTADGTASFPNSGNGIEVMDGGSNTLTDNTIAGTYQGIDICGPSSNTVASNTIGTNASHLPDFGVGNQGISTFAGACLSGGGSNGPARLNLIVRELRRQLATQRDRRRQHPERSHRQHSHEHEGRRRDRDEQLRELHRRQQRPQQFARRRPGQRRRRRPDHAELDRLERRKGHRAHRRREPRPELPGSRERSR